MVVSNARVSAVTEFGQYSFKFLPTHVFEIDTLTGRYFDLSKLKRNHLGLMSNYVYFRPCGLLQTVSSLRLKCSSLSIEQHKLKSRQLGHLLILPSPITIQG